MQHTSRHAGLDDRQVMQSRLEHGSNILTPPRKASAWSKFLAKFSDPLIIILLIAGAMSVGISFYEYFALGSGPGVFFEPTGIFIAIMLATGLAFYFEEKADKEFALLNRVNDDTPVQVIRGGLSIEIARKDVVVGDIVLLNTGEEVPADGQLLEAVSLSVDESSLTGEPIARKTVVSSDFDPEATFPSDQVLRGTKVMEGHGVMTVTAVGDHTENGKVFVASQIDDSVRTPLNEQLDGLGSLVTKASYAVAALIVAGRLLVYFTASGMQFEWVSFVAYLLQTLMIAVTLIVVAVPEGLPMAVTLSLAYSMRRMFKAGNLVRRMHACETMGATTVICTDKTGTLTQNRMQVAEACFPSLPDGQLDDSGPAHTIAEGIAVNSTAQLDMTDPSHPEALGNPTEGALLLWLHSARIDYLALRDGVRVVEELPFTTERKYMATLVRDRRGRHIIYVKGAPEIVAAMCGIFPQGMDAASVDSRLLGYQRQGMRTLGFACVELPDGHVSGLDSLTALRPHVRLLGIVAIADPVRPDVPDAVSLVRHAGIDVKIVTGDTPATAREIGRGIGLWSDADTDRGIITGSEFAALSDAELRSRVGDLKIIARARPMDKKRLVEALQANNEVVAVTGDGTNDAPALKAAHVGLSMGDGTAVAKEASDITIIDNSFSSIGKAVMWGRSLYLNIQRFILFQLTVNVVASLIVLAGAFMGMQSPLTVTQMLWVNLIMDTFAAIALSTVPPSADVMDEKPRSRTAFIISPAMGWFIAVVGGLFFVLLFGLLWYLRHTDLDSLTQLFRLPLLPSDKGLSPYELSLFFTTFVFLQFWNLFNAKAFATGRSALHFKGCSEFVTIALFILVGQVCIVEIGRQFFNVQPLRLSDWVIIICGTSIVFWAGEIIRLFGRKRKNV